MRSGLILLLLLPGIVQADPVDELFHLPSSVALTLGGDSNRSKSVAIDMNYSTPRNWQFLLGAETSEQLVDEDSSFKARYFRLGVGSDPLELFSGFIEADTVRVNEDYRASGAKFELTFAPLDWTFSAFTAVRRIHLTNIPNAFFTEKEIEVRNQYSGGAIEYLGFRKWTLRVFGATYTYNKNLTFLSSNLAPLVIHYNALTMASGLLKKEGGAGVSYQFRKFSLGLELVSSTSEVDESVNMASIIKSHIAISKAFGLALMAGNSRTVSDSSEPGSNHFMNITGVYSW